MIGETIGNFRIVSRLGRGGMGEVYLAEQTSIGTRVAVKLLHASVSEDKEHVTRFFNEARAVQRIQHAGIVKIFDVGFHASGHAYLVMEYLEGESLTQRIRRMGKLHPAEIADLGRQIASVLEATHGAGITHRDLKPDNIYIVADRELASRQRAKILDFGIAKLSGTLAAASPQTIGTMGTPAYMAPEQWGDASKVDWRADIYSLGCVAFEMATGRPPFVVTTIAEACGKHLGEVPVRARTLAPELPPELDDLIAQMLEKKPDARPASMEAITQRFDAIGARLGPAPVAAPPPKDFVTAPTIMAAGTPKHAVSPLGPTVATGEAAQAPTVSPLATLATRGRRWPWILAALVLAGGGAAAGIVMMKGRHHVAPPAEPFCEITAPPVLDGAGTQPVLMRYQFAAGQRTEVTAITQTKTTETLPSHATTSDDVTITLEGIMLWTSAEANGKFLGRLEVEKISVDRSKVITPPSGQQTHETMHWRSDDGAPPPAEYKPLLVLLGLPVPIALDARGEVTASGIQSWQDMLDREHASPALRTAFARDEVFRTMFVRLPDQAVKVGDHWRAGELVRKLPNVGEVSAKIELSVAAISKDGSQVLLEAAPELHVDLVGAVTVKSAQSALRMWSQFDLGRHDVVASALRACADVELEGGGIATKLELVATYDPRPLGSEANVRPPSGSATKPPTTPPTPTGSTPPTPTGSTPTGSTPPTPTGSTPPTPTGSTPPDASVPPTTPPVVAPPDAAVVASAPPDAASEPPPTEPPTEPPPSDASDLTALLGRAMTTKSAELTACAPEGGKVNVALTLAADGTIRIRGVTGLSPAANRCIAAAIRGLKVPRARRGPEFPVNYPLVIVGSQPAPTRPLPESTPKLLASLRALDPAVRACGEQFPGGSTQSDVNFVIAPDGTVASATAKAAPPELRVCIEAAAQAAHFEPSKSGRTVSFGYKVR